ncbi:MAG: putative secondary metabolism biosynthetic enzyme [Pycnora praestabilis]|nr:MAG: putative secondary metabolism biosynthetic enzyme [Pycnora praestabilis]
MWLELHAIFENLSYSPSVRAIVLTGAGDKAFTAGLDVQAASQSGVLAQNGRKFLDGARKATNIRRHIAEFQDCITALEKCEKPVICVLHGYTLGLGIDIATAADVRICASNTKFAIKEVDIGLAADIGTLTRLPKVVGSYSWVKDVCLTARIFGVEEALRVGLVSGVYEDKARAVEAGLKMAALIASKSPVAVQGTKELLNFSRDHNVQDGLRYTGIWNAAALQSSDVSKAMQAGMQKRTATFEKL